METMGKPGLDPPTQNPNLRHVEASVPPDEKQLKKRVSESLRLYT